MIDFRVYDKSIILSEHITSKGYTLSPSNNTLLSELVKLIDTVKESTLVGAGSETTAYTALSDDYIKEISNNVNRHVKFARGSVLPLVRKFMDDVKVEIGKYNYNSPEDSFDVKFLSVSSGLVSLIIKDISKHSVRTEFKQSAYLPIGKLNDFDYLAYVTNEVSDELNIEISKWFSNIGVSQVMSYVTDDYKTYNLSLQELADFNMSNYLLYRAIRDNVDLDFGLSRTELKTRAKDLEEYFAANLKLTLSDIYALGSSGELIAELQNCNDDGQLRHKLTLFKDNFDIFVDKGGSLESIFGAVSGDNSRRININTGIANLDKMNKAWDAVKFLHTAKNYNSRLDVFKKILINVFDSILNDNVTDEIKEMFNSVGKEIYMNKVHRSFKQYKDTLKITHIDDLNQIALTCVAKIIFYPTASFSILSDMNDLTIKDSSLDPREASLIASINYIADFFIKQMVFIKN